MTSSYQSTAFQSSARPVDTFVRQSTVPLIEEDGFSQLTKALSIVNPVLDMYMDKSIEEEKRIGRNKAIQEELDSGEFGKVVTDIRKKKGEDAANQAFSSIFAKKAYGRQKAKNAGLKIDNILTTAYQTDTLDFTDDDGNTVTKRLNEIDPTTSEFTNWYNNKVSTVLNSMQNDVDEEILDQFFFPQMQKAVSKLNTHAYKEYNTFVKNQLTSEATVKIKENAKIFVKAQTFGFKNPEAKKLAIEGLQADFKELDVDMRNAGITGSDATKLNETYIAEAVNLGKLAVAQGNYDYAAKLVNFLGDSIPGSSPGKTLKSNPKWTEKTTDFFYDLYIKEGEIKERDYKLEKINRRNRFTSRIQDYRNEANPIIKGEKYEMLKLDFPEKEYQTDIDEFGVIDNKPFNEKAEILLKNITRGVYFVDGEPDKGSAYNELDKLEQVNLTPDSETEAQITLIDKAIQNMKSYSNDLSKYEDEIMDEVKQKLRQPSGPFGIRGLSNKNAALSSRYQRILQDEADQAMSDFVKENKRPMTRTEIKQMYRRLEDYIFLDVGIINDDEIQTIPEVDAIGVDVNPFSKAKRKTQTQTQKNQQNNKVLQDDSFDLPPVIQPGAASEVTQADIDRENTLDIQDLLSEESFPDYGGLAELVRGGESQGSGLYNAYNGGTTDSAGEMDITSKTIAEMEQMQANNEVFAVGAYQFTPGVLTEARIYSGVDKDTVMTPAVQDRLFWGMLLSGRKRPALAAYLLGQSEDLRAAHEDLALEFAAIQGPDNVGMYDNDVAGNYATIDAMLVRETLVNARNLFLNR
tara:strand:- start:5524 stop:7932 length:2409 start_codon:yes stop_codon:yes gene_type:complete